ncbi:MAG: hypothetical protein PHS49_06145 [Candidatus Gracilibacteria bacterium]|nr:hypothetical protein [Candidatus Gracilibacteria bacterium]
MYSILLIIYSIILFILFNLFLYLKSFIFLALSIILFFYILYNLFKIKKKEIPKITIIYSIFIIIFIAYIINYSHIKIEDYEYNFLEITSSSIDNNINQELKLKYDIKDYNDCQNKGCEILENYKEDINSLNNYIKYNYNIWSIIKISKDIKNTIEKKELLSVQGIDTTKYKIDYDEKDFIENHLKSLKLEQIEYLKMNNSIFLNKKQYIKYLDNYYYKIYELYINNNIEGIIDLDKKYERNIYKTIINRKYFYNVLIYSPKNIYNDIKIINSFELNNLK